MDKNLTDVVIIIDQIHNQVNQITGSNLPIK